MVSRYSRLLSTSSSSSSFSCFGRWEGTRFGLTEDTEEDRRRERPRSGMLLESSKKPKRKSSKRCWTRSRSGSRGNGGWSYLPASRTCSSREKATFLTFSGRLRKKSTSALENSCSCLRLSAFLRRRRVDPRVRERGTAIEGVRDECREIDGRLCCSWSSCCSAMRRRSSEEKYFLLQREGQHYGSMEL